MNDEEHMLEVKHRRMMMTNEAYDESESREGNAHYHVHEQHISDIDIRKREWLQIISLLKSFRLLSTPIIDMRNVKATDVRR